MNKLFASLLAVCVLAGAASAQLQTLTTTFASNNGQSGNMFDIQATNAVEICSFDVNVDVGTWDFEVYTITGGGSYVGQQNNAAAWTLVGAATGVVSNGLNVATPLPIPVATPIAAGATMGFYVTVTNGTSINYTNGTTTGAIFASDANITFFEGSGHSYPFGSNFNPRVWNGNINYVLGSGCPSAPPPDWQVNSAISSLDVDGLQGNAFMGAVSTVCIGAASNLNSASTPGTMTDVLYNFTNSAPALPLTTANNTVNIDVFHPTVGNLNGGMPNFAGLLRLTAHPGAFSFPIPTAAPLTGSAQQLAIDATNPDGYTLSQACEINVTAGGIQTLTHIDDGTIQVFLNANPLCGTSVDFYGTSYTDIFSNSNGSVSFTVGNTDFTATSAEWQTQEPRIGIGTDLEPNNFGTVTVANAGPGLSGSPGSSNIVVSYTNVTEWGTMGMGVSTWDIVLNGGNGHEIANFATDGTWGMTACVGGITLGTGGTHPALVSFDTQNGAGLQANANSTDSVIDENTMGMLLNASGWTSVQFPLLDGSSYVVQ